jgi:hypothetical protein
MLRPTAIQVEAICAYQILVEFDNRTLYKRRMVWKIKGI